MPNLNEPPWEQDIAAVQKAYKAGSALCNIRVTPSIVTGILLRIIQSHFYDPENIRDKKLKQLVWHDDNPSQDTIQSQLLIGPLYQYDKRQLQERPAVLVFRQQATTSKFPMESKTLTSLSDNGNFDGEKYVMPVTCTHIVRCCAKTAFAAERIGEEVFYRLLEYTPSIKEDFPFSKFDVVALTAPSEIVEDANENFMVDVAIQWATIHGWTLMPIAPILKKVRTGNSIFQS